MRALAAAALMATTAPLAPSHASPHVFGIPFAAMTRHLGIASATPFQTVRFDAVATRSGDTLLGLLSTGARRPQFRGAAISKAGVTRPKPSTTSRSAMWTMILICFGAAGLGLRSTGKRAVQPL